MAFLQGPFDVHDDPALTQRLCPQLRLGVHRWTDHVMTSGIPDPPNGLKALTEDTWELWGITSGTYALGVGFYGHPCRDEVTIDIEWNKEPGSTYVASIYLVDNKNGVTNIWSWDVTDGNSGTLMAVVVDISQFGACAGYLMMNLEADNNSNFLSMKIADFA